MVEPLLRALQRARLRGTWRSLLRALHRDAGYLAVGLTLVYAVSGLAVNHIADWDPNFRHRQVVHPFPGPLASDDAATARKLMKRLGIEGRPKEVYRASPTELEITLDDGALHVDAARHEVVEERQESRFLLRAANWLHLNRGKKSWTLIADGYAVFLIFLAISGLFMIPGRRGLIGRGAILALIGMAVPVLYVALSGGP
jgi:uncharacterized protein